AVKLLIDPYTGRIVDFNRAAEEYYGYSRDELKEMTIFDLNTLPRDEVLGMMEIVLKRGKLNIIFEHKLKSGEIRDVEVYSGPVTQNNKRLLHTIVHDVTELQKTQRKLVEQERTYRTLFTAVPDPLFLIDQETGRLLDANKGAERVYGYTKSEFLERTIVSISDEPEKTEAALREPSAYIPIRWHRRKNGAPFPVELTTNSFIMQGKPVIMCTARDISDRVKNEKQLKESLMLLEAIFQNAAVGIALVGTNGQFEKVNEGLAHMIGVSADDILGADCQDVFASAVHGISSIEIQNFLSGKTSTLSYEEPYSTKDGRRIWLNVTGTPISDDGANGQSGAILITRDVTKRREAEDQLHKTNEDLLHKNEELDRFSQTVAHDLKNPLSVISGLADLVQNDVESIETSELLDIITHVKQATSKMHALIESLLELSRVEDADIKIEQLDMKQILDSVIDQIQPTLEKEGASLTRPETLPMCYGYAPWIENVWINYISNAVKYGGSPPEIVIESESENENVVFHVKDNGRGIPPDKIDQLFRPFTRLESKKAEGHGLGLSIVRRIIDRLGGETFVSSEVSKGSTFSFTLPANPPDDGTT
ncbi:MAG: hypothetical protein CL946_02445, partial [Ectothiorhodospiraceae bacterium]|nr:hypothetical protein [Ectothiorhodospiraceae bacterium]